MQQQQQQQQQQQRQRPQQQMPGAPESATAGTKDHRGGAREKPLVKDLNEHIVCPLCRGYLIDATTLVECLHSFCRGCIVQRLNGSAKSCPVCGTSALAPLVPDVGLQRLVYLIVPGLFRSEQERRRHFHQQNPECSADGVGVPRQPPIGAPDLGFDDLVSLSLCDLDSDKGESTRYLKCPAGVTVRHLLRLLMLKRGWNDSEGKGQQCGNSRIEILYGASGSKNNMEPLDPAWTLVDLACIFEWKGEAPMKLLYHIIRLEESAVDKSPIDCYNNNINNSNSSSTATDNTTTNADTNNQVIENIQRPPTPPPSPKPTLTRTHALDKNSRPTPAIKATVIDQYIPSKELESKKPLCEVTPVIRAPDPIPIDNHSKSGKLPKLEHQRKRKKRRNKRVIAEITTTPREDLLKLKLRLTPCPPRVSSTTGVANQAKDKLIQMRAVRKDKTKSSNPQNHQPPNDTINTKVEDEKNISNKDKIMDKQEFRSKSEKIVKETEKKDDCINHTENKQTAKEEAPKNEDVLRRLGLVAISEANKTRQEKTKSPAQPSNGKNSSAMEREKLEKQLRESKANRVRSLLAEKQMRDTLKSIMSNSKDVTLNKTVVSTPSSSTSSTTSTGTPTINSSKRKEPPPLTPLRSSKRSNVTFAPTAFTIGKLESPLDLSSPSSITKDNVLDLSSNVGEVIAPKCNSDDKPIGILRNNRTPAEKSKEETKKTQDTNLRTLSDAAVSLLGDRSVAQIDKLSRVAQNFLNSSVRIPQPHQRITGFGMKIKPNIGVRHIPNPQAVVASQYRNQRSGYFNLNHQPP